jgi:hypothetical protein
MHEENHPKHLTERELHKFSVEIIDKHSMRLRCEKCGEVWSPNLGTLGRLPSGYWRCPNGCNIH